MSMNMDRRSFLKGAAIAGASAAAVGLIGCSSGASAGAAAEGEVEVATNAELDLNVTDNAEADIVVVGGGAAGSNAAVRAAQLGLNVALVECADHIGGTAIFSEGIACIHSHYHKEHPEYDIPTIELVDIVQDYNHWLGDAHIFRNMIEQSATNIDWLESLGHQFDGLDTMLPDKPFRTWVRYHHEEGTTPGDGYMKHWGELINETYADNITVYYGSEAVQTKVEDGAVSAVIIKDMETEEATEIACKAVIYACGGYADNGALFKELVGFSEGEYQSNGMGFRTGDGLIMGRDNGAAFCRYPSATMWFGGVLPGTMFGSELFTATSFQPLLWINQDCSRFIGEHMVNSVNFNGNCQSNQKRVVSLLTQAQLDSFVNVGCINGCGAVFPPGTKLDGSVTGSAMWDEYEAQVNAGNEHIYVADTLDGLAEATGLDAGKLKAAVESYNKLCAAGEDIEFGKPAEFLLPLNEEDGPYYAFDLVPGAFTTVGGLKVNDCVQVLTAEGEPIVGMYAAGCDAGGLYGDSYDLNICEGSQQCWCAYSGKLAAEHIASTLFDKPATDEFANPNTWSE